MVKIWQIGLKMDKVMTSVTLTFDLERPKYIQHIFRVICTSLPGLVGQVDSSIPPPPPQLCCGGYNYIHIRCLEIMNFAEAGKF